MNSKRLSWRDCQNFHYILQAGTMMSDDGMSTIFQPTLIFSDGRLLPSRSPEFMRRGIPKIHVDQRLALSLDVKGRTLHRFRARAFPDEAKYSG